MVGPDGRVGGDAVSLGGQVRIGRGGPVQGDVTSLSVQLGGFDLAQRFLDESLEKGPCQVEMERPAKQAGRPRGRLPSRARGH